MAVNYPEIKDQIKSKLETEKHNLIHWQKELINYKNKKILFRLLFSEFSEVELRIKIFESCIKIVNIQEILNLFATPPRKP